MHGFSSKIKFKFTLVEMLVVVSVFLVLLSLLSPSLKKIYNLSFQVNCNNILGKYSISNHIYADDNNDIFVPIVENGWTDRWYGNKYWKEILGADGNNPDIPRSLKCPSVSKITYGSINMNPNSYGFNYTGLPAPPHPVEIVRSRINESSSKIQMIEANIFFVHKNISNYQTLWDLTNDALPFTVSYRHNEGANMCFFDGHTEYRDKIDVWYFGNSSQQDIVWKINSDALSD